MNEIDFFPYNNRCIVFKLDNGQEFWGIITTEHMFVPIRNFIAWKYAIKKRDDDAKALLEEKIDIQDIVWAERLNY